MKKNKKSYEILTSHLKKIQKENPKFSIRALGNKLNLSHSFLINILNGKRPLPLRRLEHICEVLKIDEFDQNLIKRQLILEKNLVLSSTIETPQSKEKNEVELLPENHLKILRQWWNLALLDFIACFNESGISKNMILEKIPATEYDINISLNELQRLKLIEKKNDRFIKTQKHLKISTRGPQPITRHFYKMALQLASQTLDKTDQTSFNQRLITTVSCSVNPAQIPKARIKLAEALAEVRDILSEGDCTDVFFLQAQMFSVLK